MVCWESELQIVTRIFLTRERSKYLLTGVQISFGPLSLGLSFVYFVVLRALILMITVFIDEDWEWEFFFKRDFSMFEGRRVMNIDILFEVS